jgi:sigma-E factor negative regulatory protein RseB
MLALDQIDGRAALPLRFNPVDRWRYGTTLWVDRSTGLVVKTEVRNIDGQPLAQTMLAQLEVLDAAPQTPPPSSTAHAPPAPVHWHIQGLPEGFSVLAAAPGADGEQLVVSDGIASVSVFIEPLSAGQQAQRGQQQRGLLSTQAEVRGDYQLIAVGAVPPHTIERILNGITPAQ